MSSPWGDGKSWALGAKAHILALEYPGNRCVLLREQAVWCRNTTLVTYRENILGPTLFDKWYAKGDHLLVYPNGSTVAFAGLDDTASIAGSELGYIGVDEVVPPIGGGRGVTEDDWKMLGGRLRNRHARFRQLAGATNPGGPNHWLLERVRKGRTHRIDIIPGSNDINLPSDYLARKQQLEGVHRARYLFGEWIAITGLVYCPPWDRRVHCPQRDLRPPAGHPIELWIDWGYHHEFACLFVWRFGKQYLVFDEIYGGGRTVQERCPEIDARWPANPVRQVITDSDEDKQQTLRANSRRVRNVRTADKHVGIGVESVLDALRGDEHGPGVLVDMARCPNLVLEMESYPWDPKNDRPEKSERVKDHALDALRYGLHTNRHGTRKPEARAVSHLGDLHFSGRLASVDVR